ncbi:hypothetical protein JAAARDRAFT_201112 [Jaapia argillacea MUCL 33604]|uniref:Uncharacterized protein n=1 Tax=Jaapia argillacea MUCL 33604 TaxID=933084 RepID=A0A067P2J6_9AGAM|nr:hypothetical protein JAAARDRAFT_201112 [Jaapia argillacea MUCL 33604]
MFIRRSSQTLSTGAGSSRQLRKPLSTQADQDPQPRPLRKRPRLDIGLFTSGSQDPEVTQDEEHDLAWWENRAKMLSTELDILGTENTRLKLNAADTARTVTGLQGAVAQLEEEVEDLVSEKQQFMEQIDDLEDEVGRLTDEEGRLGTVLKNQRDINANLRADVALLRPPVHGSTFQRGI